jgi:hypothetical protein
MLDTNFYLCIPALQVWLGYYDEIPISFLAEYFLDKKEFIFSQ